MVADTVKSASITTLDGAPQNATSPTQLTEGIGASGRSNNHSDFVAATTGGLASASSVYKMVRLPTSCIVKSIAAFTKAGLDSSTGLAIDIGAYYSDSTIDGTPVSLQGTLISANCFLANTAFGQSGAGSRIAGMTALDAVLINSPLWAQVGLTTDPGGYIDIAVAVHTVVSGSASAGNIGLSIDTVN